MIEGTCTDCASHGAKAAPVDTADFLAAIDAAQVDFTTEFDNLDVPTSGTDTTSVTGPVVFA